MPLLKNGKIAENEWTFVADDADLSDSGCCTISVSRYLENADEFSTRNEKIGVRVDPGDDIEGLVPYLEKLGVIEVSFPKYADGRGYSSAQLLRRRHGYEGELRAVGQVLHDQVAFMVRAGFDAIDIDHDEAERVYTEAVGEFTHSYQSAADPGATVFEARHGLSKTTKGA